MSITGAASDASRKSRRFLGCFFVVFALLGLAFSSFFLLAIVEVVRARDWRETPCTILTSEVQSHSSSKGGPTYSVAVTYEYVVDEQHYTSSRYKFMSGSSSGYEGKKAIVDRLGPGTKAVCYVNRHDPADAVIERGFTGDIAIGCIPLIFVAIGVGGLFGVFVYKGKPKKPAAPAPSGTVALADPEASGGVSTLKPKASPVGRLGCTIGIALFWNAITSIFFFEMVSGWMNGKGDGCMTVFLIPFELIGIGLIGAVVYYFLALFNPRPTLQVAGGAVAALGETIEVEWSTTGNVNRVKAFTITFEGREEATYKRGTSTTTDKSTFLTITLVTSTNGSEMRRGKALLSIPADTMHSFKSRNNKIVWTFKVAGDIPRWPDIGEEFDLEVLPQRPIPGGPL